MWPMGLLFNFMTRVSPPPLLLHILRIFFKSVTWYQQACISLSKFSGPKLYHITCNIRLIIRRVISNKYQTATGELVGCKNKRIILTSTKDKYYSCNIMCLTFVHTECPWKYGFSFWGTVHFKLWLESMKITCDSISCPYCKYSLI